MSEFNPSPHDRLVIGGHVYQVMPHPSVPSFAFGQEGRKAFVFQLSNGSDGGLYALKKFKVAFRVPELVDVCDSLARFAPWPGLEVCARQCLRTGPHDDALGQFPDLEYAVLMPWITGSTWYDVVIGSRPLSRLEALTAANGTAQVLAALEEAGLAHCDISGPNVIINLGSGHTHLIDVEDLYAPGFNSPASLPSGTDGYAHRTASNGLWTPAGDRFAGAVIMAEMAAWHSPEIRKATEEEHFFAGNELQQDTAHFRLMMTTLGQMDQRLADLFDQAWQSQTLEECPRLKDWHTVINEVCHREQLSKVVTNWEPITGPGAAAELSQPGSEPKPITLPAAPAQPAATPIVIPTPPHAAPVRVARAPLTAPASPPVSAVTPATGKIQAMPLSGPVIEWRPLGIALAPQPEAGNGAETDRDEAASPDSGSQPATSGLLKPVLDLSHVDKGNKPYLVWSESPGAAHYLLEESDSPDFHSPRKHKVKAGETHWHPTWGRSGKQFYRVQARTGDETGPWSDVLTVRIAGS